MGAVTPAPLSSKLGEENGGWGWGVAVGALTRRVTPKPTGDTLAKAYIYCVCVPRAAFSLLRRLAQKEV